MKDVKVKCPNCHASFSLQTTDAWQELHGSIEKELKQQLSEERAKLNEDKERVQMDTFKLAGQRENLRQIIERELNEKHQKDIKDAKQLVLTTVHEQHALTVKKHEKIVSDLSKQLELARQKVESYTSQELKGELNEVFVEETLQNLHPTDKVIPVPRGIRGADSIHEIIVNSTCQGKILVECKLTQTFSSAWLKKLKSDNKSIGAQALMLVTAAMPKELEGKRFGIIDDVFIVKNTEEDIRQVSLLLRYAILRVVQATRTHEGRSTKESVLFDYITSTEFQGLMERTLTQLDALKASFEIEKKRLLKVWSEQEKLLTLAITSNTELFGSLQGITGQSVPQKNLQQAG